MGILLLYAAVCYGCSGVFYKLSHRGSPDSDFPLPRRRTLQLLWERSLEGRARRRAQREAEESAGGVRPGLFSWARWTDFRRDFDEEVWSRQKERWRAFKARSRSGTETDSDPSSPAEPHSQTQRQTHSTNTGAGLRDAFAQMNTSLKSR